MNKESVNTIILTIQVMSVIMMVFFGWLTTKMELHSGAVNFWGWLNLLCLPLYYIVNRKTKQR